MAAPRALSPRGASYSFTAWLDLIAIRARPSCDRTLFVVGVALDQARIDGKAFAANQTGRDARLDNLFDLLPFAFIGRKGVGICVVPMVRPSV